MLNYRMVPILMFALAFTACQPEAAKDTDDTETKQSQQTTTTSKVTKMGDADQMFIDQMTPHHEMAVMMADEALEKASQAKTKDFAHKIKTAQIPEIQQLKGWRKQWYGSSQTPSMEEMKHEHLAAGPDYDRKWVTAMIEHHQMAVDMSKQTLTTAQRPEIKQMAEMVIDAQTKEIKELQTYLKTLK